MTNESTFSHFQNEKFCALLHTSVYNSINSLTLFCYTSPKIFEFYHIWQGWCFLKMSDQHLKIASDWLHVLEVGEHRQDSTSVLKKKPETHRGGAVFSCPIWQHEHTKGGRYLCLEAHRLLVQKSVSCNDTKWSGLQIRINYCKILKWWNFKIIWLNCSVLDRNRKAREVHCMLRSPWRFIKYWLPGVNWIHIWDI